MFNEDVLPVMDYGIEAWTPPTTVAETLARAQRKTERVMRGITSRDRQINTWIRQQIRHNRFNQEALAYIHCPRLSSQRQ